MEKDSKRLLSAVAFFVFLAPVICAAQTSGVGSIKGGLVKGGAGSTALAAKLEKVVDRGVFTRLAKKSKGTKTSKKKAPARKSQNNAQPKSEVADSSAIPDASMLTFRPSGETGTDLALASLLTSQPDEKAALLLIFSETKKAYEAEATKAGRQNDLAFGVAFFMAVNVTVFNDTPEPGDAATESLYNSLSASMLESPDVARMSDLDKQIAHDTLVYASGLILSGYVISKQNGDEDSLGLYRQAAGVFLFDLTGIPAEKMEFDVTGLVIKP